MKNCVLLLLFSFVFFLNENHACSCIIPSSFCESITDENGISFAPILLRGEVTSIFPSGKEIAINHILSGDLEKEEIVLRNGFCTLYYNELEEGSEYLFALSGEGDDYYLIACALSFLKIENDVVIGRIAPGVTSANYNDLSELKVCGNVFESSALSQSLEVFPNPSSGVVKIKNASSEQILENLQLRIYDIQGRLVKVYVQEEGILPEDFWLINIEDFAAGLYLFKITNPYQDSIFKILKQNNK